MMAMYCRFIRKMRLLQHSFFLVTSAQNVVQARQKMECGKVIKLMVCSYEQRIRVE